MVVACGSTVGCGSPGDSTPIPTEVRLTLLHTADWHSRLFPYTQRVSATDASLGLNQSRAPFGGAARMNWLIQRERAHADRLLHLDSGDCFQGAPIFNFFNGEAEVRALGHTGVDAVVIGNHEFDRGALNFARQYRRWATFPVLASNYLFDDPTQTGSAELSRVAQPYHIFNLRGLRVAVIGFGNLSSITSIFDQPNRLGITPLNTRETAQFYVDQVRSLGADVVVGLSHVGLSDDVEMIQRTTGFDVILGGHLHIVLNPTQQVRDCEPFDAAGSHFVPEIADGAVQRTTACNPSSECCSASGVCPPRPLATPPVRSWTLATGYRARACSPRTVLLQHSGAFMKYLGRLDVVLTNVAARIEPGRTERYDAANRYEVVDSRFTLFPVDSTIPEEPTMARLLEPYARSLDSLANLDTLVGYAPDEVSRTAIGGGDSPMGNLVSDAMWLRLGIQTDFALTNTLGIRDAIPPGPVSVDQVFNVFPFDNSITTMFLAGREVIEMFDFVARRSSGRGCNSQAQIAGARVVISCGSCDRDGDGRPDTVQEGGQTLRLTACAETINIGLQNVPENISCERDPTRFPCCENDSDCNRDAAGNRITVRPDRRSLCEPRAHICMQPIQPNADYALAANNYIAGGGSGFFVLQRNTTQVDTLVQQRDAVIDRIRNGIPCGATRARAAMYRNAHPGDPQRGDDGLQQCANDSDCDSVAQAGEYLCSCPTRIEFDPTMRMCVGDRTGTCAGMSGRCVLRTCRNDLATLMATDCPEIDRPGTTPQASRAACLCAAQSRAGETCRILSCVNDSIGAQADGRLQMLSRGGQ